MRSPRCLLCCRVGKPSSFNFASLDIFSKPGTSRVILLWTFSSSSMSLTRKGHQLWTAYSKIGLTNEQCRATTVSASKNSKFFLIIPTTLLAFPETSATSLDGLRSFETITPRYFFHFSFLQNLIV